MLETQNKRIRRHIRVRSKIMGTKDLPRFSAFRSSRHMHAQLIDDQEGRTIVSAHDFERKPGKKKTDSAKEVGMDIAKKAKAQGIERVVFDRGGYRYHGRVKALAEGAREGGLKF